LRTRVAGVRGATSGRQNQRQDEGTHAASSATQSGTR
jgi:hypothetical protein